MRTGLAFVRRLIFLTLSLSLIAMMPAAQAQAQAQADGAANLFIYLEVPVDFSNPTALTLADLTLHGDGEIVGLFPLRRRLVAQELAGTQILLGKASVAPGFYDTLMIHLGAVTTRAGAATVQPPLRPQGYAVSLDAVLRRGEATVVSLVWQPAPAPTGDLTYVLSVHTKHRPVPPLGSLAFVTESESGTMMIVDRLAGRVVGATVVGENPRGVVYSPQRQKLYVAVAGEDGVGVVDGMTLRLERVVPLNFGDEPSRVALSPDQSTLYVLNEGSRTLVGIATRSMQEQYRANVGDGPRSLAVDPGNGYIYVACEFEGEVQVFNPAGLTRLSSLLVTAAPVEVVIAESTRQLYVASASQNRIHGLDLEDGRDLGRQTICGPARFMVFNPRSRRLFASIQQCGEVAVVRPADGVEFASLAMPAPPAWLTFDPGHRKLLVLLPQDAALAIFEVNRGTLESRVDLGGTPYAVVAP